MDKDHSKYAPYSRPTPAERNQIVKFLSSLPIGLEREDLRVIHAAWCPDEIAITRALSVGSVRENYDAWENESKRLATENLMEQLMAAELESWEHSLENMHKEPPFMHSLADYEAGKQMLNPLKVLTSGVERKGLTPFYAGGKWRFVERVQWWDEYEGNTPVVFGHYWRRVHKIDPATAAKGNPDLFGKIHPYAWHGHHHNVFCVDFSVGGRWTERKDGKPVGRDFKLAALRWPERVLQFDDSQSQATKDFSA
jgi:hypothetical protein